MRHVTANSYHILVRSSKFPIKFGLDGPCEIALDSAWVKLLDKNGRLIAAIPAAEVLGIEPLDED